MAPCRSKASRAYAEQEGVNRQLGGRTGEIVSWYTRTRPLRNCRGRSTTCRNTPFTSHRAGQVASRQARSSARSAPNVAPYASRRVRMSRSHAGCAARTSRRQASFSRRRSRFRSTAVAWNRGTISPMRGWPTVLSIQMNSRNADRRRRPLARHRRMSAARASRRDRGKLSLSVRPARAWTGGIRSSACAPSSGGARALHGPSDLPSGRGNHAC